MKTLDLNVVNPEQVAKLLRQAAEDYNASAIDLQSAWQDNQAGKVWSEIATILEQAATKCDKACAKYFK